jgi:hypothetical protein
MEEIKIEKGIEIPMSARAMYPFSKMQVGDSFEFDKKKYQTVKSASRYFRKTHKPEWKFVCRTVADGKCRIWRYK